MSKKTRHNRLLDIFLVFAIEGQLVYAETPSFKDQLQQKYSSLTKLVLDLEVTKNSAALSKPLKSSALLTISKEEFIWQAMKPVKSTIIVTENNISIDDKELSNHISPPQKSLLQIMRKLSLSQFDTLASELELDFQETKLTVKPKTGYSSPPFALLTVEWDQELRIKQIKFSKEKEQTILDVKKVIHDHQ